MIPPRHLVDHLKAVLLDANLVIQSVANSSIKLWLISPDNMQQRIFNSTEIARILHAPPYWAFCWGSGVALSQWLLENPTEVAGKKLLDFGAGSGCVAIAAKLAGADQVTVCDSDIQALAACRANAALNAVELNYLSDIYQVTQGYDLILAADILYDKDNIPWLDIFLTKAERVLVADSRVKNFRHSNYQVLAQLYATTIPDLSEPIEFQQVKLYQSI